MGATPEERNTGPIGLRTSLSPLFLIAALLIVGGNVSAQQAVPAPAAVRQDAESRAAVQDAGVRRDPKAAGTGTRLAKFLLGGAAGLGLHEGGHLAFDGLFGARPIVKKVDFGGIPFFAITHASGLPPRQEFTISSAGFWMQHLTSEIVLTRHPRLRDEASPVRKGMLAFNVLASVAYGAAAMAKAGPTERDTRAMAETLRVNEPWVGAMVIAPAALDAWRFAHPDSRWAKWVSRAVKVGMVLLVVR